MDDFLGGLIQTEIRARAFPTAQNVFRDLIQVGIASNTHMNLENCEDSTRSMDMIDMNFNSKKRVRFLLGRPFITEISHLVNIKNMYEKINLHAQAFVVCDVW